VHQCAECGERATCAYSFGTEEKYACAAHDPLRPPFGAVVNGTWSYRTLHEPLATTAHLGHLTLWPPPQVLYPRQQMTSGTAG
jgi:hypothetical protein